jgi:hypothetical protein
MGGLEKWILARSIAVWVLLDVALAYGLYRLFLPNEEYGWIQAFVVLAALGVLWGIKRWIYSLVSVALNRKALCEGMRRAMVDSAIPAPPMFGMEADSYLDSLASDRSQPDNVRLAAARLATEARSLIGQNGFVRGLVIKTAIDESINQLKR